MTLAALTTWLEATPLSQAIAESAWLFPTIESVHVIALTLVVGSISVVDLRLLGWASRDRPAGALIRSIVPVTWGAFALAATSGVLLFTGKPSSYAANPFFLGKLALLALAGLNMAGFHLLLGGRLEGLTGTVRAPAPIRASATASLLLWVGVVALGRWIGFTI